MTAKKLRSSHQDPMEATERNNVVYLQVPAAAAPGEGLDALAWALVDACQQIEERDAPLAGVALVCGTGPFWVRSPRSADDCDAVSDAWAQATDAVASLSAPTIACLGGDAVGAAWELALACDLRLASSSVQLGSPEIRWGRMPGAGGTQRLTRLVGQAHALRLLLSGALLDAETGLALGLLVEIASDSALEQRLEALLDNLRASAPIALAYVSEAVRSSSDLTLQSGLRLEADLAVLLQTTNDRATGIQAFLDRREAKFEGR